MKESKDRTEQFMFSTAAATHQAPPSTSFWPCMRAFSYPIILTGSLLLNGRQDPMGDGSRPSSKGKGRAIHNGDVLALDLDSAEEGSTKHGGNAFMQMQQIEQQVP